MFGLIVGIFVGIVIGYYQPEMVADVAVYITDWIKSI